MQNAIEFENVSKKFKKGSLLLKEALVEVFKAKKSQQFWALKDITFNLPRGTTLGILGPNGSGKSTLLKLIAQVMFPTRGLVKVNGRVAPLIELGAGFHFELTGRENIYINGSILGLKKRTIDERIESIIDFAELSDFIDVPVKHYSSGMFMRLGFSVATHVDPEILLIDEILAVGDQRFQEKCFAKIREFQNQGVTVILITHSSLQVVKFCNQVMVLQNGELKHYGDVQNGVDLYQQMMSGSVG